MFWTDLGDLPLSLSLRSGSGKGNTGPMVQLPSMGCLCHFHPESGCLSWDRHLLTRFLSTFSVSKTQAQAEQPSQQLGLDWRPSGISGIRAAIPLGTVTLYPSVILGSSLATLMLLPSPAPERVLPLLLFQHLPM